jgi:hypothetical protein
MRAGRLIGCVSRRTKLLADSELREEFEMREPRNATEAKARLDLINQQIKDLRESRPTLRAARTGPHSPRTRVEARARFEETNMIISYLLERKRSLIAKRKSFS